MNVKLYLKLLVIFIFSFAICGCTSTIDFDQLESIELNQNLTYSFIFFQLNQNHFLDQSGINEVSTRSDVSVIDIFNSDYVQENLVGADFSFEIENTFNREFEIEFSFLNFDGNPTETFVINVPENTSITHLESFEGLELLSLKFSRQLRISMTLLPSSDLSMLDRNNEMQLILKSFTNFIFKVN